MARRSLVARALVLALVAGAVLIGVEGAGVPDARAAIAPQLLRYPYLTDVVQTYATINFATDTSGTTATVKYGRVGQESCVAKSVNASKTTISVKGQSEYQWKAKLTGLATNTLYCYRVFLGGTDLLGDVASPQFWTQIPAGTAQPFSFAVFGDWGDTDANGANPYQAALMQSIANSGVRFALTTGDTAYDSGTQSNYGDLTHTGYRVSSVFGPDFWTQAGDSVPLFNAVGNHGMTATYFTNWPQTKAVSTSSGKYLMETYCCENGANSQKSPSAWYAFDAGNTRMYVLTTAWGTSNVGTSDEYGMDYAYRWQKSSPEYQWLKNDLQTHPSQLKFAVFHYPLYSDNATEPSDPYLQGPNSLEGLLEQNGVNMAFNGHAHLYQHNAAPPGGIVTYVTGGGGAAPEPITKCKSLDTYGLGWSATSGGSSCGSAPKPTQVEQVYHYIKVDVNGYQVTVSGVNALGQTFDVTTYDFAPDLTPPTAPSNLQATAPAGNRVDLTWDASVDPKGIAAYDIYRDGGVDPIATVNGNTTTYSDLTVAENIEYSYVVKARDPSNNVSDPSNTAVITTPSLDPEAPSAPTELQASAFTPTKVNLTWSASTDNVGVTAYDIYRDANLVGSVAGNVTAYADTTVAANTPYTYTVRARDAASNSSGDSNAVPVTTPAASVLFQDDFETGSLGAWTTVSGLTAASGYPAPSGGVYVARGIASGTGATSAYRAWSPTIPELYAQFRFKVIGRTGGVDLMRFRNSSNGSKLALAIDSSTGKLSTRNSSGATTKSNVVIANGQWYTVQIHGKIGATPVTEVWLDGVLLPELGATGDLGSTNFGQFLLGHTSTTGTYDVVFDDVVVSKNQI
jgi:chitodextrinase